MATLPKDFIGTTALQHVAEQVTKEILMGPGYTDAEEMDRLAIDIVSGVQYKRTIHILSVRAVLPAVRTFILR